MHLLLSEVFIYYLFITSNVVPFNLGLSFLYIDSWLLITRVFTTIHFNTLLVIVSTTTRTFNNRLLLCFFLIFNFLQQNRVTNLFVLLTDFCAHFLSCKVVSKSKCSFVLSCDPRSDSSLKLCCARSACLLLTAHVYSFFDLFFLV